MKFQVGDRVLCISPDSDSDVVYRDTGTVWYIPTYDIEEEYLRVGVEWDNYCRGHRLDDSNPCKANHGWYVYARTLQLLEPAVEDVDINFKESDIL